MLRLVLLLLLGGIANGDEDYVEGRGFVLIANGDDERVYTNIVDYSMTDNSMTNNVDMTNDGDISNNGGIANGDDMCVLTYRSSTREWNDLELEEYSRVLECAYSQSSAVTIDVPEAQVLCPLNKYRETVGGDCIDVPETQVLCPLNKYRETVGGDCIDVPEPQVLCPLNKYRETAGGNCIDVPGAACGTFAEKLSDYRGTISVTETERTCQKWTDQWPHSHSYTPENKELMGLGDHNYCRNPSPPGERAWCYTTDPNKRWEYCDVPECYEESASQENVDEGSLSIILPIILAGVLIVAVVLYLVRKRRVAAATPDEVPKLGYPKLDTEVPIEAEAA